jgi:hypothetical protein
MANLVLGVQELPHGFPVVQCGPFVSAVPPLTQALINCFRESPLIVLAAKS